MEVLKKKIKSPYTQGMVVNLVMETVCEVLGSDQTELSAEMSIGDELGAESLDFVEIRYILERRLGISLPQRSVLDHLAALAPGIATVAADGKLSTLGAQALRDSMFNYSDTLSHEGVSPNNVMQGATIRNWADLCFGILDTLPDACPDCGHTDAVVSRTGKSSCASCGAVIKPLSGDDAMAAATEKWLKTQEYAAIAA